MPLNKAVARQYRLDYVWPSKHQEVYDPTLVYELESSPNRFHLASGWREAFEARRRRVVVFKETGQLWPVLEFVGVDGFESSGRLIWPLKKPGGNEQYALSERPHQDYHPFEVSPFRDYIDARGAFRGWGLVVHEDDHDTILKAALVRDRHRQRDS